MVIYWFFLIKKNKLEKWRYFSDNFFFLLKENKKKVDYFKEKKKCTIFVSIVIIS